jgi:hypothetical protein
MTLGRRPCPSGKNNSGISRGFCLGDDLRIDVQGHLGTAVVKINAEPHAALSIHVATGLSAVPGCDEQPVTSRRAMAGTTRLLLFQLIALRIRCILASQLS